jgi:hypothetical protein
MSLSSLLVKVDWKEIRTEEIEEGKGMGSDAKRSVSCHAAGERHGVEFILDYVGHA